ncbi:MAG: hypothetical protein ABSD63_12355 [Candidatus Korobacteraceae bacterium]|jgi:hypothetical protein
MAGRLRKVAGVALRIALLTPVAIYLALLAMEAYSAHQASIALTRLENLKLGDPISAYERAVSGFVQSEDTQLLISGPYRLGEPVLVRIWLSNEALGNELSYQFNRAGLRFWQLRTSSSSQDGKLTKVSVGLMVVGRNEMLGSGWRLVPKITDFHGWSPRSDLDERVVVSWFHITSNPPGEGYHFEISSEATPQELQARQLNRKCLLSFRGCENVCELMPNLLTILRQRNSLWQAVTDVPSLPCGSK